LEDTPPAPSNRDILFEVRTGNYEYRCWRDEINGDLAFLRQLRSMINHAVRVSIVAIPVTTALIIAWMAR